MTGRGTNSLRLYTVIGLGSAIGAACRWLLTATHPELVVIAIPWSTLFVNVSGSFLIGLYATLTATGGRWPAGERQRHFVIHGVLGGYTTFSIFSLENLQLMQAGRADLAVLTIVVSIITWLLAVWAGQTCADRMSPRPR